MTYTRNPVRELEIAYALRANHEGVPDSIFPTLRHCLGSHDDFEDRSWPCPVWIVANALIVLSGVADEKVACW